jgi:hypothetical protein
MSSQHERRHGHRRCTVPNHQLFLYNLLVKSNTGFVGMYVCDLFRSLPFDHSSLVDRLGMVNELLWSATGQTSIRTFHLEASQEFDVRV